MCKTILVILLTTLLSGCLGLPTIEIVPTTAPTTLLPTATATAKPMTIEITGDVYVRDDDDNVLGWLYKADHVRAVCSGDWCQIFSGGYSGYHFWRGCSSDNPEHKSCQAR
jgi:hypothetical protein